MEEPPPEIIKMASEAGSRAVSDLRMASAASMDSSVGVGCPPRKYRKPRTWLDGIWLAGSNADATMPSRLLPSRASRAAALAWAAFPMEPTDHRLEESESSRWWPVRSAAG